MAEQAKIIQHLFAIVEKNWAGKTEGIAFPPPSFTSMQGQVVDFRLADGWLKNRFPILPTQLNPYGLMQGGFIGAAIDNTIGPLSMLVAPPNLTVELNLRFAKAVSPAFQHVFVTAHFKEQQARQLRFEARVENDEGVCLASAKSMHWILDS